MNFRFIAFLAREIKAKLTPHTISITKSAFFFLLMSCNPCTSINLPLIMHAYVQMFRFQAILWAFTMKSIAGLLMLIPSVVAFIPVAVRPRASAATRVGKPLHEFEVIEHMVWYVSHDLRGHFLNPFYFCFIDLYMSFVLLTIIYYCLPCISFPLSCSSPLPLVVRCK